MRGIGKRRLMVLVAVLVLGGCAAGETGGGGLVTPASPVLPSPNPSALPVGDTIRTGVMNAGRELVLYFWGSGRPYLDEFWYGPDGPAAVDYRVTFAGGDGRLFLDLREMTVGQGTLIDFGAVRGPLDRLVCAAADGATAASFAPWSADPTVYVFWLVRRGSPLPEPTPVGEGRWEPLSDEHYPLCTAYGGDGRELGSSRLKPPGAEQKGG
ncbi:hypothetical protein Cs7R123_26470 [Catellatospora sp. TT07R-123]|uniref:hypothetical protein n=1 Tax=Catellatospora sp. TT07R-123 TaxID=2733863 RepID=UPI001B21A0A4|nr:hypothetical protein [Catellatospora sp. TT07R-123]GHJ45305.1 hypothetical protein Cs7R123_26470 [Catellatospora sp. TT07R-123]